MGKLTQALARSIFLGTELRWKAAAPRLLPRATAFSLDAESRCYLLCTVKDMLRNRWNAMCSEPSGRTGDADRGDRMARRVENRCTDAARTDLHFLIVDRVSTATHTLERFEKFLWRGESLRGEAGKLNLCNGLCDFLGG